MSSPSGHSPLLMPSQPSPQVVSQMTEFNLIQCEGMTPIEEPLPMENETKSSDYDGDAIERMDITMKISEDPNAAEMNLQVATLFNQVFGPKPEISASQVSLRHMSGAMTNRVYIATIDPAPIVMAYRAPRLLRAKAEQNQQEMVQIPAKYIVRVYGKGTEAILSREKELFWVNQLTALGFGAQVYTTFGNGRVEKFLECATLTMDDMRDESTSRDIAQRLCELHTLVSYRRPFGSTCDKGTEYLNGPPGLWANVDLWMRLVMNKWPDIRRRCDNNPQCADILDNWHQLEQSICKLKAIIKREVHSPLVFTHNDLQYGNILRLQNMGKIEIVDFEFSGYNYRGFDIANHFCEWMYDYSSKNPHLLDLERYPTTEERHNFLRSYVYTKASIDAKIKADQDRPTKDWISKEVAELDREVAFFLPASLLHWSVHGLLKACCTEVDFDYVGFAAQRLSIFIDQVANLD
ncbi:hypothetical protein EV175_005555 [Coemansia sp. RSA 1933]|nr:hypothetical protein EV175_005555 [Coemansia sp. RSA 1933]